MLLQCDPVLLHPPKVERTEFSVQSSIAHKEIFSFCAWHEACRRQFLLDSSATEERRPCSSCFKASVLFLAFFGNASIAEALIPIPFCLQDFLCIPDLRSLIFGALAHCRNFLYFSVDHSDHMAYCLSRISCAASDPSLVERLQSYGHGLPPRCMWPGTVTRISCLSLPRSLLRSCRIRTGISLQFLPDVFQLFLRKCCVFFCNCTLGSSGMVNPLPRALFVC